MPCARCAQYKRYLGVRGCTGRGWHAERSMCSCGIKMVASMFLLLQRWCGQAGGACVHVLGQVCWLLVRLICAGHVLPSVVADAVLLHVHGMVFSGARSVGLKCDWHRHRCSPRVARVVRFRFCNDQCHQHVMLYVRLNGQWLQWSCPSFVLVKPKYRSSCIHDMIPSTMHHGAEHRPRSHSQCWSRMINLNTCRALSNSAFCRPQPGYIRELVVVVSLFIHILPSIRQ